jgi:16S rRNA G1207 methylase RsmC
MGLPEMRRNNLCSHGELCELREDEITEIINNKVVKYFSGKARTETEKYIDLINKEKKPYFWKVGNIQIIVLPSVFSPKYFRDPDFFYKKLPVRRGEKWLEIGCGTGILTIVAAKKGASVTAVDINPTAVKNTRLNIRRSNLKNVKVLRSNVYTGLPGMKFDTIFWNTPWGRVKKKRLTKMEAALWDTEYKSTERFIAGAKKHLLEGGRLLVGFSSTIGDLPGLRRLLQKYGYHERILARQKSRSVNFKASFEIIEARSIKR